jgi:hypothetical protein
MRADICLFEDPRLGIWTPRPALLLWFLPSPTAAREEGRTHYYFLSSRIKLMSCDVSPFPYLYALVEYSIKRSETKGSKLSTSGIHMI